MAIIQGYSWTRSRCVQWTSLKHRQTELDTDAGWSLRQLWGRIEMEMRGLRRGAGGGGWHPRTNKYLFRILHGTPLQRVWFPGSTALLMHPSTPYSHPQSSEIRVGAEGGGERTSWRRVKERAKLYVKVNNLTAKRHFSGMWKWAEADSFHISHVFFRLLQIKCVADSGL